MSSPIKMDMEAAPASTMHNGRQRLRPFLITLINSGTVKGLEWLDKEHTLFKIPWKHAGKQDYDPQEDSKIFMLWSANTGKYKEGIHEPEPAVWKTRLRTALNKLPDIEEIHEKTQLDIPEPYRVYKLLPKKASNANSNKSPQQNEFSPSTSRPQMRSSHSAGGNVRSFHSSVSFPNGMECPDAPHPNYPPHYSLYDYQYPNPICDIGMGHYSGFSASNTGYSYYQSHHQPVLSPRHHPYPISTRHHSVSSSSSVDALTEITEVIQEEMGNGNANEHQEPHHYTNMDNMAVQLQQQQQHMKIGSAGGMHQYVNNNNDPAQMNYHDPTSVTSAGMTIPYNSPPTGGVPLRPFSSRGDYEQHASPPSAMNAITMASNVLSGEDEGLVACTASDAMPGICRRQSIKEESHCLPHEHEMTIRLYYKSTDAGFHHIRAEAGCMVYFRVPNDSEELRNMDLIQLPDIKKIPETEVKGKQREYIARILDCCERGVSLVCRDGAIYVKRHCRSVLFWSTSEDPSCPEKLERDVETKIFDLTRFRLRLRQYYEGTIPSPVVPEIYFSIAQKLHEGFPLRACFITFVVRPLRACEELRTINDEARTLPHSSHSGLLKFSGPDMHSDVFATSTSPMAPPTSTGLGPWGDMSPYAASCPIVPQPTAMQVN
ncbi:uncharacterized protein [Diadema setosum]|uniref:uncharacterized protein n=1 Tax=Diadema setosum TaxID=31175 RepID=UPI003B3BD0A3